MKKFFPYLSLLWVFIMSPLALPGFSSGEGAGALGRWPVYGFLFFLSFSTVVMAGSAYFYWHEQKTSWSRSHLGLIVGLFGACFFASMGGEPWIDDDLYRYLWDGFITAQGKDPVSFPPISNFEGFPSDLKERIAFADVSTVYPPVAQWFFAVLWLFAGSSLLIWNYIFGILTFLTLIILMQLAQRHCVPFGIQVILLMNPVFIKEFADSCHIDILGIFFLGLGLLCLSFSSPNIRLIFLSLCISLSCLVKPIGAFVLPFLPKLSIKEKCLSSLLVAIFSVCAMLAFFKNAPAISSYLNSLQYFQSHWVFSPGLAEILKESLGFFHPEKSNFQLWHLSLQVIACISMIFLASTILAGLIKKSLSPSLGVSVLGGFFVIQGVVNPWYLFWLWPLIILLEWKKRPRISVYISFPWLVLPFFLAFSGYTYWIDFHDISWLRRFSWFAWFVLFTASCIHLRSHVKDLVED